MTKKLKLVCGAVAIVIIAFSAVNVSIALTGGQDLSFLNLNNVESLAQNEGGGDDSGCYTEVVTKYFPERDEILATFTCQDGKGGDQCVNGYEVWYYDYDAYGGNGGYYLCYEYKSGKNC